MKKLTVIFSIVAAICVWQFWPPATAPQETFLPAEKHETAAQNSARDDSVDQRVDASQSPPPEDQYLVMATEYADRGDQEFVSLLKRYRETVRVAQFEAEVARTARIAADQTKDKEDLRVAFMSEAKAKQAADKMAIQRKFIAEVVQRKIGPTNRP